MPCYNAAATVSEAIGSVAAQSIPQWELLVVDDASNDDSPRIVEEMADTDFRIRLIHSPKNQGVAAARNIGVAAARGEFIAFLDSDDRWEPEKLTLQLQRLEETGADLCCTSYRLLNADSTGYAKIYRVPEVIDYSMMLRENFIGCSTVLVHAALLPKPPFDSRFFHEDYALWLRLLQVGCKAVGIEKPLVDYRPGGKSADKFKAARHRYAVYRQSEGLSVARSLRLIASYACRAFVKHAPLSAKIKKGE
jgi:teichuronic acid biosynthesis glycosyltransferase TuaG